MMKSVIFLSLLIGNTGFCDVYPDTINQRRELSMEEKQHLLHLGEYGKGGCSGSALTPDTLLTAEHCLSRYANGEVNLELSMGYLESDPSQTFKVVLVVEKSRKKSPQILDVSSHYANDVLIAKIKWDQGKAPAELRYARELVIRESDLKIGKDEEATPLYTIGYPMDREKKATYSWGYLKGLDLIPGAKSFIDPYTKKTTADALYLKVNVPLINGNSGGAVYTGNYKLVGTVHGGSTAPDSEKNSPEYTSQDPRFWNRVAALYYLYPKMKTLQTLFPNGINPNVNEAGEWVGKY